MRRRDWFDGRASETVNFGKGYAMTGVVVLNLGLCSAQIVGRGVAFVLLP